LLLLLRLLCGGCGGRWLRRRHAVFQGRAVDDLDGDGVGSTVFLAERAIRRAADADDEQGVDQECKRKTEPEDARALVAQRREVLLERQRSRFRRQPDLVSVHYALPTLTSFPRGHRGVFGRALSSCPCDLGIFNNVQVAAGVQRQLCGRKREKGPLDGGPSCNSASIGGGNLRGRERVEKPD
jgi:hypothetical protein